MALDDLLLILSNIGIVIVTGWMIVVTIRDAHKHEERIAHMDDVENQRLIKLAEAAMKHEQEQQEQSSSK